MNRSELKIKVIKKTPDKITENSTQKLVAFDSEKEAKRKRLKELYQLHLSRLNDVVEQLWALD